MRDSDNQQQQGADSGEHDTFEIVDPARDAEAVRDGLITEEQADGQCWCGRLTFHAICMGCANHYLDCDCEPVPPDENPYALGV